MSHFLGGALLRRVSERQQMGGAHLSGQHQGGAPARVPAQSGHLPAQLLQDGGAGVFDRVLPLDPGPEPTNPRLKCHPYPFLPKAI